MWWVRLFLTGWFDHSWVLSCVFLLLFSFHSCGDNILFFLARDVSVSSWVFWLGFPGLICLVAVRVPVGLVFLLFMAGLSGLLECIHNLLFTFLSLRFIYSFNIFICRYIYLTVYFIVHVYYIICYIVLSQLCFIF